MLADRLDPLAVALSAGPTAVRVLAQALADAGDTAELARAAAWLLDHAPPSLGRPLAAYCNSLGKDHPTAIAQYEEWLLDVDAPPAWHLAQLCKSYQRIGKPAGVYRTAARFHPWDLDHEPRLAAARAMVAARARSPEPVPGFPPYRLALMSTFNTASIEPLLRVALAGLGFDLDLYVPDFDQLRLEVADPSSGFYRHDPAAVILATTHRDLLPGTPASDQAAEWARIWDTIVERSSAHVLQHTFDRPFESPMGHLEPRLAGTPRRLAAEVNALFWERAPARVSLVDYEHVIYRVGGENVADRRQWYWAKEALSASAAVHLVEEYAAVLRGLTGKARKVLVLDLDNTMWGGIVGEDGVNGLKIGPPSIEGESHQALQSYAKELRARGVLLAVCSKNNPDDARAPFTSIADMKLSLDDFVAFEASWDPKPVALRRIAEELNVGLDSFVFVDDNPAERAYVRRELPEVLVIPVGSDPSTYVASIHAARAFEAIAISEEDRGRSDQYIAERQRKTVATSAATPEEYYRSLEMVATVRPFIPADFERVVQLAARSNQFNLTTWRLTHAEVAELSESPKHDAFTLRLRDRFGDYGLVAVLIAEQRGSTLEIVNWCMSCRILGRTVEQTVIAELDRLARARGCDLLVGVRKPTKKNVMVKDLYDRLGFSRLQSSDEDERWQREVALVHHENPHIRIEN